ncbi:MAG: DegV family protein [Clostridia bacterium]|nr:DegV family protein [Clostridia bacterium]
MSVQIIVDSACDIPIGEAQRLGLIFLPLKTIIDGVEYLDGVTISPDEFYKKLASCKEIPTTSQVPPSDFSNAYGQALSTHDEVLVITLSSKISGTYQSAVIARGEHDGKVWVVDSESACVGERALVDYAVRLRDAGMSAGEIADELNVARKRICLLALVDTLKYLHKGGRLSRGSTLLGTVLRIKPVLSGVNGELAVLGKVRGTRQGYNFVNDIIQKRGIDFSMPMMFGYSGSDDSRLREYLENSRGVWDKLEGDIPVCAVGSTIGAHVGPGFVAMAFFAGEEGQNV